MAAVGLVAPLQALHLLRGGFAHILRLPPSAEASAQPEKLPFTQPGRDLSNFSAPSLPFKHHFVFLFDLFSLGLL